jgi:RNA polymerase sigma factor (sigma-70 family)
LSAALQPKTARPELEELIGRTRGRLKGVLAFHRIPPQDAEDLLQEVFLALVRRWGEEPCTIRDPENWLTGVAYRMCRQYFVRCGRQPLELMEEWKLALVAGTLDPPQFASDRQREVGKRLARLESHAAERVWLYVGLDFSRAEVAARTGCRRTSVSKMVDRSLRKLRAAS